VEQGIGDFNFMNIDLQGAELLALKGATEALTHVDAIYTEVNKIDVYVDCVKITELDSFLADFSRVETEWAGNAGWGMRSTSEMDDNV